MEGDNAPCQRTDQVVETTLGSFSMTAIYHIYRPQICSFHGSNMFENEMGSSTLQHHPMEKMLREAFHLLTITLLSLLLPLSFLLLARLSVAHYLLSLGTDLAIPHPFSFVFSLFLYANPTLLHALVSIISLAALVHGLTGRTVLLGKATGQAFQPRLYIAWIFLCTFQVCVGLGIEVSIAAGIDSASLGIERSFLCRMVFFLGLHETMLHWCRTIVKAVADNTIFGAAREERWVERVVMASSLGGLWCWRLRDEVESLVFVAEMKREMLMGVGMADFTSWWLYYLTVTTGMVRVVKGLMWVGMVLLCKRRVEQNNGNSCGDEEKV